MRVRGQVLCTVLGVQMSRIYQYTHEGMPKVGMDLYDLPACVQWRLDRAVSNPKSAPNKISDELKRSTKAKIDLQIAQMRGELIPRELAEQTVLALLSMTATQLESLPPRVASDLAGLSSPMDVQDHLLVECRATRDLIAHEVNRFADEMSKRREAVGLSDDAEAAEQIEDEADE